MAALEARQGFHRGHGLLDARRVHSGPGRVPYPDLWGKAPKVIALRRAGTPLGFSPRAPSRRRTEMANITLVDDAIVVVENIHRHQQLHPGRSLREIIPHAVDEVGGPTILATFTVIAALLPMAFVSGLMGPYMSPIPINASMGMLLSLAVAFVITPWLARLWMKEHAGAQPGSSAPAHSGLSARIAPMFERVFTPLLDDQRGGRNRRRLGLGVAALIALSVALPVLGWVQLKMLPFDNKSEFQVVVDMPAGTPAERTAAVLHELGAYLASVPEVTDYQAYAGLSGPINFNGKGLRSQSLHTYEVAETKVAQ
eukprot:gene7864-10642_t